MKQKLRRSKQMQITNALFRDFGGIVNNQSVTIMPLQREIIDFVKLTRNYNPPPPLSPFLYIYVILARTCVYISYNSLYYRVNRV